MADILIRGMEMPDRRTTELMHTELACVSRECDRHCENCDLVQDRDELIAAFNEAIRVLETVANAVPLQVVRGEWVSVHDGYGICSNCHRGDHIDSLAGFCRFCGADMRKKVGIEDD